MIGVVAEDGDVIMAEHVKSWRVISHNSCVCLYAMDINDKRHVVHREKNTTCGGYDEPNLDDQMRARGVCANKLSELMTKLDVKIVTV